MPAAAQIDWTSLGTGFDPRRITRFTHRLHEHPLLQASALHQLARRVEPLNLVKFKSPSVKSTSDLFLTEDRPAPGSSLDQIFEHLDAPATWLAIYELTRDPAYRPLCDELLADIAAHLGPVEQGLYGADLAIFLSAPPAFTPYHIDQHPVFFFQLRGKKRLSLWDASDASVLPPELAEDFLCNKTEGRVRWRDELAAKAIDVELSAGQGVYWPATTPHLTRTEGHWATKDDGYSLSFNISYYTEATKRRLYGAALNQLLRNRAKVSPRPFRDEGLRDAVKARLGKRYLQLRRLITGRPLRPEQGI